MANVKVYDKDKKEVGEISLAPEVFEVEVKPELLNLVVRAKRAEERKGTHSVKNRAIIHGGGSKPWRQKGTGRARAGSNRSPIWRGGAVIFGPQPRDYSFKLNKKVKRLAMKMALSARLADEGLTVVKSFDMDEIKTKKFRETAENFGLKKALIVVDKEDNNLALSARNIPGIKVMTGDKLSVYEILKHPQLIIDEPAVTAMQERLQQ